MTERTKACLVIGPIGDEKTDIRTRADNLLQQVVKDVLEADDMGYTVTRADDIEKTGSITSQIIERVRDADLVVADLAGFNANVIYELALRHVETRPVIMLKTPGQKLPFDIQQDRAIEVEIRDLESVARCKARLKEQARAAEEDPVAASQNPVSGAIRFMAVSQLDQGSVLEAILARLERLEAVVSKVEMISTQVGRGSNLITDSAWGTTYSYSTNFVSPSKCDVRLSHFYDAPRRDT